MRKILICMANNRNELYWKQYFRGLFFQEEVEINVWYTEQPDASIFCIDDAQVQINYVKLKNSVKEKQMNQLTDEERAVLDKLAEAWNLFVKLPVQHPMHGQEFAHAIHAAQRLVMSRPVARTEEGFYYSSRIQEKKE